ncbi:MAG: hypothetical protein LBK70_00275 [Clostridiales bacterium]|nr:hypothetical protein [Clostridiales bacterium]
MSKHTQLSVVFRLEFVRVRYTCAGSLSCLVLVLGREIYVEECVVSMNERGR